LLPSFIIVQKMSSTLHASPSHDGNKSDKNEEAPEVAKEDPDSGTGGSEQDVSESNSDTESDSENSDRDEADDKEKSDNPVMDKRKRPFLDDEGKETIRRLRKSYEKLEAQKWIDGAFRNVEAITLGFNHLESCVYLSAQLILSGPIRLTASYRKSVITLPGQSEDSLHELHKCFVPSKFGKGTETVYDESYRLARDLAPDSFSVKPEALKLIEPIMPVIADVIGRPVRAGLYKLNSYATGGFFGAHKDTPKSEDHIGTLVVCLPNKFTGGNLVYTHKGEKATFDWSEKLSSESSGGGALVQWVFAYSDIEHSVEPIKSGFRFTLAYDIFVAKSWLSDPLTSALNNCTPESLPFYQDLR
jgi:hypothetical protein